MSKHILTPGPQHTVPVGNGYAPRISEGGPRSVFLDLNFTVDSEIDIDFTVIQQAGALSFLQSVFIDNSANLNPLTIVFDQVNQRIVVPAQCSGVFPVIAPISTKATVTTTPAANLRVGFLGLNMPMPLTQWGPITVNVANVNASALPVIKNFTATTFTLTGGDDVILPANAARSKLRYQGNPNNAAGFAINYGAAAVLATNINFAPGQIYDSGTGPVSGQAIHAKGTNGDVINIEEA